MEVAGVVFLVFVALLFDFYNGMNDAANSIATVVSTRVLSPIAAVVWAAVFNFVAFLIFKTHVAATIGKGVVQPGVVDLWVILGGLVGAIVWLATATHFGLPISASHSLIGGFVGSAVAKGGFGAVMLGGVYKILLFIVLSPAIGMALGLTFMLLMSWVCCRKPPAQVDRYFRKLQLCSAALYSLGHGGNDAQKTMGIIAILLYSTLWRDRLPAFQSGEEEIALWIVLVCHFAIALGTLTGGWRVIRTLGMRLTKIQPVGGFCAETAAAISIWGATFAGIPISTTHTITGSVIGVGSVRRLSAVRWGVAANIVWAWVFTVPGAAAIAAVTYSVLSLLRLLFS